MEHEPVKTATVWGTGPGPLYAPLWHIEFEWSIEGERAEVVGMTVRPYAWWLRDTEGKQTDAPVRKLTAQVLRSIPIGRLTAQARADVVADLREGAALATRHQDPDPFERGLERYHEAQQAALKRAKRTGSFDPPDLLDYLPEGELTDEAAALVQAFDRKGPGRKPYYGLDHYQQVARAYLEAFEAGDTPTKAVAERWVISKTTAAKWVSRCRELGLLSPTTRGKAGGRAASAPAERRAGSKRSGGAQQTHKERSTSKSKTKRKSKTSRQPGSKRSARTKKKTTRRPRKQGGR